MSNISDKQLSLIPWQYRQLVGGDRELRSCKRRRKTKTKTIGEYNSEEYRELPESVMFYILILLPASVLYNTAKFVCKSWYNIISSSHFKEAHLSLLRDSTQGFLIDYFVLSLSGSFCVTPDDIQQGYFDLKTRELDVLLGSRDVTDTCDGLIVLHLHTYAKSKYIFQIINPVTRQLRNYLIPPTAAMVTDIKLLRSMNSSQHSREYNIVCIYIPKSRHSSNDAGCGIAVLPLSEVGPGNGCGKWRILTLDSKFKKGVLEHHACRSTAGGYVYVTVSRLKGSSTGLLSVDVDKGVVREIPGPPCFKSVDPIRWPLSHGRSLTAVDICTTDTDTKLNGWIWNEAQSKWMVLFSHRSPIPRFEAERFPLRAWIKDEQLLAFANHGQSSYYICNVETGETNCVQDVLKNSEHRWFSRLFIYTGSLVFLP